MEAFINSFTGGIDQDTSVNKYSNINYYDAEDVRLMSKNSLSNGALSNVRGTLSIGMFENEFVEVVNSVVMQDDLYLFVKKTPLTYMRAVYSLTDGTTLRISVNYKYVDFDIVTTPTSGQIGTSFTLSETLEVLSNEEDITDFVDMYITSYEGNDVIAFKGKNFFTESNSVSVSGDSAYAQIERFYDRGGIYKITNYATKTSSSSPTIIYSDDKSSSKLNFIKNDVSAIGRIESDNIKKLYWANGQDPLRTLNLALNYTIEGTSANVFDYIPNVSFSNISTSLVQGGELKAGSIQYAYQYYNKNGASTTFSPLSNFIQISKSQNNSFAGGDIGEIVDKSVLLTVNSLDQNFSRIRIISLFYETLNSIPEINIISELEFNSTDSSLSIIDSGKSIGNITLEEFRVFAQTTVNPSQIESKDNILFAGGVEESTFSSSIIDNWDSRVYRFDGYGSNKIAKIYNTPVGNITDDHYDILPDGSWTFYPSSGGSTSGSDWDIPETFNCVNRSNSLYDNSLEAPVYAFNPDIAIGSAYYVTGVDSSGTSHITGGKGKNISYVFKWFSKDKDESISDEYTSLEDSSTLDLYECMPNEVYRVGVVFINNKGQCSFVKWIGDIRTPYASSKYDPYDLHTAVLEVSINNFPNDSSISGYKIVRAKVENKDKTIKTTGFITSTYSLLALPNNAGVYISGTSESTQAAPSISLISGNTSPNALLGLNNNVIEFISPEVMFNNAKDSFNLNNSKLIIDNFFNANQSVAVSTETGNSDLIESNITSTYGQPLILNTSYDASSSTNNYTIDEFIAVNTTHEIEDSQEIEYQIGSFKFKNRLKPYGDDAVASRCSGIILKINSDINIQFTDYTGTENMFLVGSIIENKDISRYGGYTVSDRINTQYVDFSQYIEDTSDGTSVNCTFGNSFKNSFEFARALFYYETSDTPTYSKSIKQICSINLPSYIDVRHRSDDFHKNADYKFLQETTQEGITLYPEIYNDKVKDLYIYNNVYSQNSSSSLYLPKPFDFTVEGENPVKIIASNEKINGEYNDSWTVFAPNNFIEVDGQYSDITKLISFKSKLYFFQKNSVGVLSVNDRSLIQDNNVGMLTLGTGGVLDRFDYISYYSGAKKSTDVIQSKTNIYFIDEDSKRIYTISNPDNSISEVKGIHSFLNDNVDKLKLRKLGFDVDYNEILFTFDNKTICYNENIQAFTSRYNFTPRCYITTPEGLYSNKFDESLENDNSYIFRHNDGDYGEWYSELNNGAKSVSKVVLLINPNGNVVNTFDNIDLRTEVYSSGENNPTSNDLVYETISRAKFKNSYINEISIESASSDFNVSKIKRLARRWRAQVPLTTNSNRFVDTYLMLTLEFDNNNNKLFKLHDVITYFRKSNY